MTIAYSNGVYTNVRQGVPETLEIYTYSANVAVGGPADIIAGVSGQRIRVILGTHSSTGNSIAQYFSGLNSIGAVSVPANGSLPWPEASVGWLETATSDSLRLTVAGTSMLIGLRYLLYTP